MYSLLRRLLFQLDPEAAHQVILTMMRLAGAVRPVQALLRAGFLLHSKPVEAFGLQFANPVGLAAGYDKDGLGWRGLACLGFGHIEIGTVTLQAQPGNPRPRLFRLVEDQALINRLGFPGKGANFVAHQLAGRRTPGLVIGVNLGKNKDTPIEDAAGDYLNLMRIFSPLADYLAINVSSPNTLGLRRLQGRQELESLLEVLAIERQQIVQSGRRLPILVKLAPDLSDTELDDALEVIQAQGMDGVIATNTTLDRSGLQSDLAKETGGLSGVPLAALSVAMLTKIIERTQGKLPVVSVGGILNPEDALLRLETGAVLVQLYTGLVYAGPSLVKQIVKNINPVSN